MAEIEHYVDPLDKVHPRFDEVRDVVLTLLPKDVQMEGRTETTQMTVGDAVAKKIVDNETLGYFLARTQLFLVKIGMDATRVRCRQHMANEMAHYAAVSWCGRGRGAVLPHLSPLNDAYDAYDAYGHSCPVLILSQDCWDFEIQSSYGWIECVGCADRSAYDLSVHAARTKAPLRVQQKLDEPRVVEKLVPTFDAKAFGMKEAGMLKEFIFAMEKEQLQCVKDELAKG
jgi:glycyl-tRNA synthetase